MKGPAEPFIVRPVPADCDWVLGVEAPLRAVEGVVKELFREELTFALPESISDAILEARAFDDWRSRSRFECEGVVEDGLEGGLNGFF